MVTCSCTTAKKNVLNNVKVSRTPECKPSVCLGFFSGLSETERAITEERAQHWSPRALELENEGLSSFKIGL